jgi:hypothetical protein
VQESTVQVYRAQVDTAHETTVKMWSPDEVQLGSAGGPRDVSAPGTPPVLGPCGGFPWSCPLGVVPGGSLGRCPLGQARYLRGDQVRDWQVRSGYLRN